MKTTKVLTLCLLISTIALTAKAQTVYTISSNVSTSSYGSGVICSNCIIDIASGVTLTVNSTCTCTNCTFVGGTVNIVSGSNLTLSGVDSFKNATVLLGASINSNNLVFSGDTVAFNKSMNLSNGSTVMNNSRVSVNAALTLNTATINGDSLHLNANLSISNQPDSFLNSNITVATGVSVTPNNAVITNTTWAFQGTSSLSISNNMTSSNSNFYLAGSSSVKISGQSSVSGGTIALTGSGNSFKASNDLPMSNTTVILSGTTGTLSASGNMTFTGGSLTTSAGSTVTSSNALNMTNTNVSLTGTTFTGSSIAVSGGSFTASGSVITSSNALTFTNTSTIMSGDVVKSSSFSTSGGSFTASGTSITSSNNADFSGTTVALGGSTAIKASSGSVTGGSMTMANTSNITVSNAWNVSNAYLSMGGTSNITANTVAVTNNGFLRIGDGTNTAFVKTTNGASVDGTSLIGVNGDGSYLITPNSSLSSNHLSCGAPAQPACKANYVYGCSTINGSGGSACVVLAAASINLTATNAGSETIALNWTDNTTSSVDHYTIERSSGNDDWSPIATVSASLYTAGEYHYTDASVPAGTLSYRIARTDENGATTYSAISSITVTAIAGKGISIHPNPATGGRFYISSTGTGEILVNVYTSTGQLLVHTALQGQTEYPIQLPVQTLSLSTVVVQTISQNSTRTFTVLVHP